MLILILKQLKLDINVILMYINDAYNLIW